MSTQSLMRRKVLFGGKGGVINGPMFLEKPLVDGDFTGNGTSEFVSSYTCAPGELVYMNSDFKWAKADNDAAAALASNRLGIVMEDGVDGQFITVALSGSIIWLSSAFPTFTGAPVYMSATAGGITESLPTAYVTAVRELGYGCNEDMLYFEPGKLKFVNGAGEQIVLPTIAADVVGPYDYSRVSGYTTAAAYDSVILNSSNKWVKTDANTASLYNGIKGIVAIGGATDVLIKVALPGSFIKTAGTYTLGANQYILEAAGTIGETVPSSGTSAQIIAANAITTTVLQVKMEAYSPITGA